MLGKHTRTTLVTAMGLAVVLSLTACNGDENGGADAAASPSASGTSTPGSSSGTSTPGSPSGTSTPGSSGASTSGANASGSGDSSSGQDSGNDSAADSAPDICRTGKMQISAADNSTGGASGVVTVSLKNSGSGSCKINGYAGVDLKTSDGDTLSLGRNGDAAPSDILASGESAAFNIYYPVNDSGGSGVRPTTITVTAPNDTTQATVSWPGGSLSVTDGSGGSGSLKIGPVGKVG
ncbi:DUF4232 domain-containing protein [Streptomyces albogriseolus]